MDTSSSTVLTAKLIAFLIYWTFCLIPKIGPVAHIFSIILLIIIFPISILVSIVSIKVLTFYTFADFLRSIFGLPDNGKDGIKQDYILNVTILAPLIAAVSLDDGRVEVIAEGLKSDLEQLLHHLGKGSTHAKVSSIEATWAEATGLEGFYVY